ncbi:Ubiquitin-conjugating enzyme E2 J1 (E2 ubiquitin-conjugating enzyme J1) (Non-canonical ubiquitin-conjugating enzyme 1) (NCUBE-1) (Yeast ubiquitin-conjugating enzyme UBC6 homolog E) (HsUBC6e) [Durusdinium trenchii]|uniref:Ubiquitin-conjugating enzyme E2 J1 (E2 ubiquitin-conjugating enzyme J1) (Non-canonical ubiquitin-conjugating enzyme 1) (NCUBE-1) (Yeast ubiquitin-conjugating enzyme UBC6 homolog E) (HsUBC6e) n=1 Tax=Durusdinium trenchii TaxID=1381693 RepID=A0ABP0SMH4_9DINO
MAAEVPGSGLRTAGSSSQWNRNNPAIRRILGDVRELEKDPSDQYAAQPLEDNMFDWHFVIRGPKGTDFEGGVYHGRIVLPSEYPFKPPSIILLTPNGRWEVNKKICLSISAYHPEQWQPAWGIRTILEALISFMTSPGDGAVGALEYSSEERRRLARESLRYTHPLMPPVPEVRSVTEETSGSAPNKYQEEIAKMHIVSLEPAATKQEDGASADQAQTDVEPDGSAPQPAPAPSSPSRTTPLDDQQQEQQQEPLQQQPHHSEPPQGQAQVLRHRHHNEAPPAAPAQAHEGGSTRTADRRTGPEAMQQQQQQQPTDWLLYYAIVLAIIIAVILYRKALRAVRPDEHI